MPAKAPDLDAWKALFAAADAFTAARCWEYVDSNYVFGVRIGADQTCYCGILGYYGDVCGLAVYRDLQAYLQMRTAREGDSDAKYALEGLVMYLNTKAELYADDLRLIEAVGYTAKRGKWPQFRSLLPGFAAWYLDCGEIALMTTCLEQALEIARQAAGDRKFLAPDPRGRIPVRAAEKHDGVLRWRDLREPMPTPRTEQDPVPIPPVNQFKLRRLMHTSCRRNGQWEADYFFAPTPIQDRPGTRPYYPYCLLVMDGEDGTIVGQRLAGQADVQAEAADLFLDTTIGLGMVPERVLIRRPEVYAALSPLAAELGHAMELELVKRLKWVAIARRGFEKFMHGKR